jgi:hypothetical protein
VIRGAAGRRTSSTRTPTGVRVSVTSKIDPRVRQQLLQHPAVRARIEALTYDVARLADATCPRGATGHLAASQMTDVLTTPNGPVGVVGYTEFYAHLVHNGTAHSLAQPWLLNALVAVAQGGMTHAQGSGRSRGAAGKARRAVA